MQEGNAALARRDYPTAEQAAREVLKFMLLSRDGVVFRGAWPSRLNSIRC